MNCLENVFWRCLNGATTWVIQRSDVTNTIVASRQALCLFCNSDCWFSLISYVVCPESTQPIWILREPVWWPWRNLAASQRRPYCASVGSNSLVALVSRQWDAVDWSCVLCDRRIHNDRASRSSNLRQCVCPFYTSRAGFFFWQNIASPRFVRTLTAQIWFPATSGFPQS